MNQRKHLPLILIVENDPRVRRLTREWIQHTDLQCRFAEAADSKEAFAQVRHEVPDLILMDISMPFVDGIEATRVIHRIEPQVPVVMLTIHEEDLYKEEALKAGASAYVNKRDMTTRLIPVIRSFLSQNSVNVSASPASANI